MLGWLQLREVQDGVEVLDELYAQFAVPRLAVAGGAWWITGRSARAGAA